jgi:hypothetical protein
MDRIFICVVLCSGLFSCATVKRKYIPKVLSVSAFDLSKYSNQGFLITPNKYNGDYESVGIISAIAMPKAKLEIYLNLF